jgi:hypothetical protein
MLLLGAAVLQRVDFTDSCLRQLVRLYALGEDPLNLLLSLRAAQHHAAPYKR